MKPYESTITVEFFATGEGVRMVITVAPLHDEEFTQKSVMGMTSQLRKLAGRFAEQPGT